jgi:uncharacterized membrane protein
MTAVVTDMTSTRPARWLMPVLIGSLALNLIVVGAAGSLLWRSQFGTPDALSRRAIPSVLGYAITLPPERVKELEEQTKEERERVRPVRRALVQAREEWVSALSAEPFDPKRFTAAQARLSEADLHSREAAFKLHYAIGNKLTPEERRGFARWRERQRQGRPTNPLDALEQPAASQPSR